MYVERHFFQNLHNSTPRDYVSRMNVDKVQYMMQSRKFDFEYWDGSRNSGYGGHYYIPGKLADLAKSIISCYSLSSQSSVLDVGCGKGFLLFEIQKLVPGIRLLGVDLSEYAVRNSHHNLSCDIEIVDARQPLDFDDKTFDLVLSINVLHNFRLFEASLALQELQRVAFNSYIVVESYRNIQEFHNLQCWSLTATTLISPEEWLWLFSKSGYLGDFEFIFFQ